VQIVDQVSAADYQDALVPQRRKFLPDLDLTVFYELAAKDKRLNDQSQRFYGMKPPRFPSMFEPI
jgi:hypothetical protein